MNNLQSLFPLGLLLDHTAIFPQLLQLCHSHIPSKARVFFHTLPPDSSESLLMLPIQLEKGMFLCVWESWERENGGDQEENEGREGQEIAFAMSSLLCSITAGQKQQGCFLAVISSPTPAFPLPHTQSCISFKVFNWGHKHVYFLKDIMPTPPISVHPHPNFCRIYPPKFPQIPTLLYPSITKLYRKKEWTCQHWNTPTEERCETSFPLREAKLNHKAPVWEFTEFLWINSPEKDFRVTQSPKAQDWMATQTFCCVQMTGEKFQELWDLTQPLPLSPPSLPVWLPDPTPGNSRATDQTTE